MGVLPDIPRILKFLQDLLLWVPRRLYQLVMDALSSVFSSFMSSSGLADNVTGMASALGAVQSLEGVAYFLSLFQVGYGLSLVLAAYLARFILRRIPFIG